MQEMTISHWASQLSQALQQASRAAADLVQEVSTLSMLSEQESLSTAKSIDLLIIELRDASEHLIRLSEVFKEPGELVKTLERFEREVNAAKRSVEWIKSELPRSMRRSSAFKDCLAAVEKLKHNTGQIMNSPEVIQARLAHRAQQARQTADSIADQLQQSEIHKL